MKPNEHQVQNLINHNHKLSKLVKIQKLNELHPSSMKPNLL